MPQLNPGPGELNFFFAISPLPNERRAVTTPKKSPSRSRRRTKLAHAVMIVDSRPIREKARREYEKALRDLEKTRQQLKRFQTEDEPKFQRWLFGQFGLFLTELREIQRQVLEKQSILEDIAEEILLNGGSPRGAFDRVMRRQRRDQPEPEPAPDQETEAAASDDFEHEKSRTGPDFSSGPNAGRKRDFRRNAERLKELYRKLVRKLHPDVCPERSVQQAEWWHQAQSAYERGDLEALEVILILCEMENRGGLFHSSVASLLKLTANLRESLRQLRSQLAACRRQPAWNFARRADLPLLAQRIRADFEEELGFLRGQLRRLDSSLERLRNFSQAGFQSRPGRRAPFDSWF